MDAQDTRLTLVKLGPGHYRLDGITHRDCGGAIQIERNGTGLFRWESYCTRCQVCDPNGWPSLHRAAQEANAAFGERW